MTPEHQSGQPVRHNPPAFNVPGVVLVLLAAFFLVQIVRSVLSPWADALVLMNFSFLPGCYDSVSEVCGLRTAGSGLWSPLSYAFLHGGWTHLLVNTVWMLAFGSPVARRLGVTRFLLICAAGAVAGAALFGLVNPTLVEPVVGASGIISALMGAACRFAFHPGARVGGRIEVDGRRLSVLESLADRTVLFFILVFFGINLVVGTGVGSMFGGGEGQVAWEAHLGGFAFGFLSFALFDRSERYGRRQG
ncbi:rhomboid family intramembrane serine protease [Consotaella aegiceratis]|uniref:rhomboid family intramembrane serine protease n=1 Tax=Consotaella aegiceratis TaxID=3097961 RepID=UPI002F3E31DD